MDQTTDKLAAWLRATIQGIVSKPEDVVIETKLDEMGLLFTVKVHEVDRGKVIGKQGTHAQALRVLLHCCGGLNDVRASLKVEVPAK